MLEPMCPRAGGEKTPVPFHVKKHTQKTQKTRHSFLFAELLHQSYDPSLDRSPWLSPLQRQHGGEDSGQLAFRDFGSGGNWHLAGRSSSQRWQRWRCRCVPRHAHRPRIGPKLMEEGHILPGVLQPLRRRCYVVQDAVWSPKEELRVFGMWGLRCQCRPIHSPRGLMGRLSQLSLCRSLSLMAWCRRGMMGEGQLVTTFWKWGSCELAFLLKTPPILVG